MAVASACAARGEEDFGRRRRREWMRDGADDISGTREAPRRNGMALRTYHVPGMKSVRFSCMVRYRYLGSQVSFHRVEQDDSLIKRVVASLIAHWGSYLEHSRAHIRSCLLFTWLWTAVLHGVPSKYGERRPLLARSDGTLFPAKLPSNSAEYVDLFNGQSKICRAVHFHGNEERSKSNVGRQMTNTRPSYGRNKPKWS